MASHTDIALTDISTKVPVKIASNLTVCTLGSGFRARNPTLSHLFLFSSNTLILSYLIPRRHPGQQDQTIHVHAVRASGAGVEGLQPALMRTWHTNREVRFRGGLVFKVHRLCVSLEKQNEEKKVAPALMRTWHPNREIGRKPIGSMNCELCHPTSAISVRALPHQSASSAISQPAISVRSTLHPDELRALPPHITTSNQP